MSNKLSERALTRKELQSGIRAAVRYELNKRQTRILNEVEVAALTRFDAAAANGEDFHAVAAAIMAQPLDIEGAYRLSIEGA